MNTPTLYGTTQHARIDDARATADAAWTERNQAAEIWSAAVRTRQKLWRHRPTDAIKAERRQAEQAEDKALKELQSAGLAYREAHKELVAAIDDTKGPEADGDDPPPT